jgi:hypothetical protein
LSPARAIVFVLFLPKPIVVLFVHSCRLDISYNRLTGTLATELGLMSGLHTIDAMGNLLTGTIPNEMTRMNPNLRLNFTDNLCV